MYCLAALLWFACLLAQNSSKFISPHPLVATFTKYLDDCAVDTEQCEAQTNNISTVIIRIANEHGQLLLHDTARQLFQESFYILPPNCTVGKLLTRIIAVHEFSQGDLKKAQHQWEHIDRRLLISRRTLAAQMIMSGGSGTAAPPLPSQTAPARRQGDGLMAGLSLPGSGGVIRSLQSSVGDTAEERDSTAQDYTGGGSKISRMRDVKYSSPTDIRGMNLLLNYTEALFGRFADVMLCNYRERNNLDEEFEMELRRKRDKRRRRRENSDNDGNFDEEDDDEYYDNEDEEEDLPPRTDHSVTDHNGTIDSSGNGTIADQRSISRCVIPFSAWSNFSYGVVVGDGDNDDAFSEVKSRYVHKGPFTDAIREQFLTYLFQEAEGLNIRLNSRLDDLFLSISDLGGPEALLLDSKFRFELGVGLAKLGLFDLSLAHVSISATPWEAPLYRFRAHLVFAPIYPSIHALARAVDNFERHAELLIMKKLPRSEVMRAICNSPNEAALALQSLPLLSLTGYSSPRSGIGMGHSPVAIPVLLSEVFMHLCPPAAVKSPESIVIVRNFSSESHYLPATGSFKGDQNKSKSVEMQNEVAAADGGSWLSNAVQGLAIGTVKRNHENISASAVGGSSLTEVAKKTLVTHWKYPKVVLLGESRGTSNDEAAQVRSFVAEDNSVRMTPPPTDANANAEKLPLSAMEGSEEGHRTEEESYDKIVVGVVSGSFDSLPGRIVAGLIRSITSSVSLGRGGAEGGDAEASARRSRFHMITMCFPTPRDSVTDFMLSGTLGMASGSGSGSGGRRKEHQMFDRHINLSPSNRTQAVERIMETHVDIVIFADAAYDSRVFALAHERFAMFQFVLWGWGCSTLGIPTIDYYILPEPLFNGAKCEIQQFDDEFEPFSASGGVGNSKHPQEFFNEQVLLLHGPPPLLNLREIASPSPFYRNKNNFQLLSLLESRYLLESAVSASSSVMVQSGSSASGHVMSRSGDTPHYYVFPGSVKHLHPEFDPVLKIILTNDPHAVILLAVMRVARDNLPITHSAVKHDLMHPTMPIAAVTKLKQRLRKSGGIGGDMIERIRVLPPLDIKLFQTLLSIAVAVLDPFPVGMHVQLLDAAELSVPIVSAPLLQECTSRHAYGLLRSMGMGHEDFAAYPATVEDYAVYALALQQDQELRGLYRFNGSSVVGSEGVVGRDSKLRKSHRRRREEEERSKLDLINAVISNSMSGPKKAPSGKDAVGAPHNAGSGFRMLENSVQEQRRRQRQQHDRHSHGDQLLLFFETLMNSTLA